MVGELKSIIIPVKATSNVNFVAVENDNFISLQDSFGYIWSQLAEQMVFSINIDALKCKRNNCNGKLT